MMPIEIEKELPPQAISKRLLDWSKGKLLPVEMMRYSQKRVREFENCQIMGSCDTITKGWQCGLGQILDLDDEKIYKVLPYLLTAYMYNYGRPKNRFVSDYANYVIEKEKDYEVCFSNDEYFGIKKIDTVKDFPYEGIGRLLAGAYKIDGSSAITPLQTLSERFVISNVTFTVFTTSPSKIRFREPYIIPDGYGHQKDIEAAQKTGYKPIEDPTEEEHSADEEDSTEEDGLDQQSVMNNGDGLSLYAPEINIVDQIRWLFSVLRELPKVGKLTKEEKDAFCEVKEMYEDLRVELDRIKKLMDELNNQLQKFEEKGYRVKGRSQKQTYSGDDSEREPELRYMTLVKRFVIWYHIWRKAEREKTPGWKPHYRIDPIQCILLFAKTLWTPKAYTELKEAIEKEIGKSSRKSCCNWLNKYMEAQYQQLSDTKDCDFFSGYQHQEVLVIFE